MKLLICDLQTDIEYIESFKNNHVPTLISFHGFQRSLQGLSNAKVDKNLTTADHVHVVSQLQIDSCDLPLPSYFVVPNSTRKISKKTNTNNIGCVGNLTEPRKNVRAVVGMGLQSSAMAIHLWGMSEDWWSNDRVIIHGWETNKQKIYDSFDCLVFLSLSETFGLVVIEAISAGIPCVLSNIEVFQQYKNIPGVVLVDPTDAAGGAKLIDELLSKKQKLKFEMQNYFSAHYSDEAILKQWDCVLKNISVSDRK